MQGPSDFDLSRRKLLLGTAASVAFSAAPPVANAQTPAAPAQAAAAQTVPMSKVSFNVNGKPREVALQRRGVRQKKMRDEDRLRGTEVRERRHERVAR